MSEPPSVSADTDTATAAEPARRIPFPRLLAYGVLPGLALLLALAAGLLKSVPDNGRGGPEVIQT